MDYRDSFAFGRILTLYFYTSNADKLLQARLLARRRGLVIRHLSASREPYDEDYSSDTQTLLHRAVDQISGMFGIRNCFFIEDTSIRLDAFSRCSDFPGMRAKEWFSSVSFSEVNEQLLRAENNRRTTVKSDIALHVPGLRSPVMFHSETEGVIADTEPSFAAQVQYPWLTPKTFNGWFVPDGQSGVPKRLGEMEFESSLRYDFRAKNIEQLLDRYSEYMAVANLPSQSFTNRVPTPPVVSQLELDLPRSRSLILIIGGKCAGKTTFADRIAMRESVQVFEASSVFKALANEHNFKSQSDGDVFWFLQSIGLESVGREVARLVSSVPDQTCVVTGLRTIEEILYLQDAFPETIVILIESDQRIRYERHIKRAREQGLDSLSEFRINDERQREYGALRVAHDIADLVISNEESMERYLARVDDVFGHIEKERIQYASAASPSELERCLTALNKIGMVATCQEISDRTQESGFPVLVYNTNRALKAAPEFARRVKRPGGKLSYEITDRGRALLTLMQIRRHRVIQKKNAMMEPNCGQK
ncbi:non-canonical purine NTP pyrophosphatase [Rhodoplanes roseus]|uniref:Uncharacterized protein n=1 Tax=Rhodoplanes roseus TaxID=29409 RepID=A0A327KS72_9BRAD|nr:non-canonical purine NTP pyrophosphatase [Rhodoplanes roseus]RAI41201.1 hypothetical protein CH341_22225 [Rhodoplanes roseus]